MPQTEYRHTRPPVALIVTSQEWVSLSIETLFSPKGYAVLRAFTAAQALDRLSHSPPDVLVIERTLRDGRGVDLCRTIREQKLVWPVTPVLLISTVTWEREERLEALRAGAWDACSLPMDGEELFLKTDVWVHSKLAADAAREQSLLDESTGFYNAHGLLRRMMELGAGAGRHSRPLACVVISVDPDAADRRASTGGAGRTSTWSATVAERLRQAGRASDTIGRLSDTEFVVVAPDTDESGVLGLAQRLKRAIEAPAVEKEIALAAPLRFGCYAVPNFRDASIAPTELLIRAAEALRADRNEPIRFFGSLDTVVN